MRKKVLKIYKGLYFVNLKKIVNFKMTKTKLHTYSRNFAINSLFLKYFIFIHKGYLFVYRYLLTAHLRRKFGELAVTRKPLAKPIKKNK